MRFLVATQDHSGLGFALRLQEEGHEVTVAVNPDPAEMASEELRRAFDLVGEGMVPKACLVELLARRSELRDAIWIWDGNHSVEENETLRREGFRVLGGGSYAYTMEHDRAACVEYVGRYGLQSPPSFRFEDPEEALAFCAENAGTAYVYKPDSGANFETFVPESDEPEEANQELQLHLASLEPDGAFILQERQEGVETNVEVWFQRGEPRFAFMALECKKKYVLDLGPLAGCALDFVFTIPLDGRAVQESVGKLFPAYAAMEYTGFGDANIIAGKDGVWFLEKCERFGYNAHPNLLFNLSMKPIGEVFASLFDGPFVPEFAEGFGASVTMTTKENPAGGKPLMFPPKLAKDLYLWEACKRGESLVTPGYDRDGNVLIVLGHGYTMPTAWEAVLRRAAQVRFPYRHYRPDGDQTNFPSSPIRRYEALKAMGFL